MPFKLKFKKSRHYSVASKSLFVITVEMLDCVNVECTLSSESTGQDCLDVVCQKLSLNQPNFFGLQYVSRRSPNTYYWVEMNMPIKRQLDKYSRNLIVYLKVMYYIISGVRLINDEVTRYHYFLQLKMDVIESRISCTPQQAIELASYSMQAEFGNYDPERHTAYYLKDFQLFPRNFTDPILLDSLTDAAIKQHSALHNLAQGTAEEYYICACQQLEGYGQEIFAVKDNLNDDAVISVSLTEVSVGYSGERQGRHYGWADIKNVINNKRDFTIETIDSEKVAFQFENDESARNAWLFCVLQHTFYRQYEMNNQETEKGAAPPVFHQASIEEKIRHLDSYEDITDSTNWERSISTQSLQQQRAQSTSCLDLHTQPAATNIEHLRSLLPSYRPAPDYETAMQQKFRHQRQQAPPPAALKHVHSILYSSQPEIHQSDMGYAARLRYPDVTHNNIEQKNVSYGGGFAHLYKPPPPYPSNRISSNSTPDLAGLTHQNKINQEFLNIVSGSSPDLVSGNLYLKHYLHQAHPVHRSQSYLPPQHGTYENLSSIFNNNMLGRPQALIVENPAITKHIKKVYDEHGNIIYCMPANMKQILQENQLPSTGFVVTRNQNAMVAHDPVLNSSTEPIYENIPLPWQNNNDGGGGDEVRSRTQSIHSAPGGGGVTPLENQFERINLGGSKETLYTNLNRTASEGDDSNQWSESTNSTFVVNPVEESSTSNSTSSTTTKSKKKRWYVLIGRTKSGEKVKSATLGREKEKKKDTNTKHRWSTGLPRFNPLPPSISKETMCQLLENKLADSQLFFEFDKIPKKKSNADFTTACHKDNAQFNRFKDVLPYEDNRLRLTPSKNNRYGYINASHITATVGSKQRFYIAAQGPNRPNLPYFWQCAWEAEVYLIVQLTDTSDDLHYVPDSNQRCIDVGQEYQVWWEFSQKSGNCVTSKVRLCHVTSRRYRTLWHMHYEEWGDQGCPLSVPHYLGFLEEMQSVHQHSMGEIPPGHNKNPPILVHCTAGVGRTGLTILSDLLLYTVDHNQEVCVPRVVEVLRHQRAYMIQTVAQYRFVYLLLIHYLKQTRLI